MIPFLICLGAFVIVFLFLQMGVRSGAFMGLAGMLTAVIALFVTMRYWYLASQWLITQETFPMPVIAIVVFWVVFALVGFALVKLRESYTHQFESVLPSLVDRVLGALFGAAGGLVFMVAVMLTLSIAAPRFWPAYKSKDLPLPVDRWPLQAYRFVETRIAGIGPSDNAHTRLPSLKETNPDKPGDFWQ